MQAAVPQASADQTVLVEVHDGIARVTLNRPRQFNALSTEMLASLRAGLSRLAADPSVRVVVLAGAGAAFSGGHDLKEMMARRESAFIEDLFEQCAQAMLDIQALPQPVIARVQGIATAAGCQLVAACDLAVATEDARFATSGINYGLFCATPAVPLSRNVSRKRAFEMLFTGDFIDAATALDWGLVNRVVPADRLDDAVAGFAASIIAKPAAVVATGKALFYKQIEAPLAHAYGAAAKSIAANMLGPEAEEGVGAFIEKRKPRWT